LQRGKKPKKKVGSKKNIVIGKCEKGLVSAKKKREICREKGKRRGKKTFLQPWGSLVEMRNKMLEVRG